MSWCFFEIFWELDGKSSSGASFVGGRVDSFPVVDVIVAFILGKDYVAVAIVEMTLEERILLNWSKILDSVNF